MYKAHLKNHYLLHEFLTMLFAIFARQRSYGYVSSQEISNQHLPEKRSFTKGFLK